MMMTLQDAATAMNGQFEGDADGVTFDAVSTDSRSIGFGMLFVALAGERFDAHDFVVEVARRGALAAVVRRDRVAGLAAELANDPLTRGRPLIAVDDPRLALGRLASVWRQRFAIPVVAVTGSNGKTTTKEMIAAILRAQAVIDGAGPESVLATQGNLNNDIGLPLTLLGLRANHRYAVVELGMNHPGEIAYLAEIARPDAAVVVNALRAHLEGLGSLDAVAREKGSIFEHLKDNGVAVIAVDSEFAGLWKQQAGSRRTLGFSLQGQGDFNSEVKLAALGARIVLDTPSGVARIFLQAPGQHNAHNATAAAALCLAAGISLAAVEKGLATYAGVKGRLQRRNAIHGGLLIDDTYNANPDSVRAAIEVLAGLPEAAPKLLVLGDMAETGSQAVEYHREVGAYAREKGIDRLFALGTLSTHAVSAFGAGSQHFASPEALADVLKPLVTPASAVLVKGSRFMRMERVVALLEAPVDPNQGAATCC